MAKLYTLLKASIKQARKIAVKELKANGYTPVVTDDFIYAEGTIPVLLVAHYDTVPKAPSYITNIDGVLSARKGLGADDRAGMYAILETIKSHHCHVLFTGGEESGCIGAIAFTNSGIKPDVNYCIELDRRGENDAVYYDGANDEFEEFITSHGWKTAFGTCTDICEVAPYLGVAAVNLSIGYQNEHRENETLDTKVMNKNIARIPELLDGKKFEWIESPWYDRWYGKYDNWNYWDGYATGRDYSWFYREKNKQDAITEVKQSRDYPKEYYINYVVNGEGQDEFIEADNYLEAIGIFLINHPTLTYGDIIECFCEDEEEIY